MSVKIKSRNVTVDLLRTFAIALMVVFHFIYDLKVYGYHDFNIPNGGVWSYFRRFIISLFLLCAGVGLVYAHSANFHLKKWGTRILSLSLAATGISILTYIIYPKTWVYFGILHFIAAASLLSIPLINRPKTAIFAAIGLLFATYLGYTEIRWPYYVVFPSLPSRPVDFVPLIPWLSLLWLGIALGHSRWLKNDPLSGTVSSQYLVKPGQHSLAIYLIHQPIIFAVLTLVTYVT